MNTSCSKCKRDDGEKTFSMGRMGTALTTAYRCQHCGHWNDLKRRKGWAEHKAAWNKEKDGR